MAYAHSCSITDLHAVAYVYPIPDTDLYTVSDVHTLADSDGRTDVHAVSDLHSMAYRYTDACAHCHSCPDADTGNHSYSNTDP